MVTKSWEEQEAPGPHLPPSRPLLVPPSLNLPPSLMLQVTESWEEQEARLEAYANELEAKEQEEKEAAAGAAASEMQQ